MTYTIIKYQLNYFITMLKKILLFVPGIPILFFNYKVAILYLILVCIFLLVNVRYKFIEGI